ncbi:MAG: CsgG/HfaB family protein [Treponema sp.]|jgi:hypothetical protein|nr:CsgG/HfaB family protein [Treponema sp.]
MKKVFVFSVALFAVCGYVLMANGEADNSGRRAGSGETEVLVQRAEMPVNSGFKERVYIDGKLLLTLANGESGRVIIPNGEHIIHADLYTLSTGKVSFAAQSRTVKFIITPYSLQDFAIEKEEDYSSEASIAASAASSVLNSAAYNDNTVEGSLLRASSKIMEKFAPGARIAIVYVTSKDTDTTEFIANELEFIMVEQGLTLIDRSQLDRIRREQNFQMSGEVDDAKAVSVGKIAGADIIITGAVTGTGDLRRLRLRALDTQTGQVFTAASERY